MLKYDRVLTECSDRVLTECPDRVDTQNTPTACLKMTSSTAVRSAGTIPWIWREGSFEVGLAQAPSSCAWPRPSSLPPPASPPPASPSSPSWHLLVRRALPPHPRALPPTSGASRCALCSASGSSPPLYRPPPSINTRTWGQCGEGRRGGRGGCAPASSWRLGGARLPPARGGPPPRSSAS